MGRCLFCCWFDVNRSTFDEYARRTIYFYIFVTSDLDLRPFNLRITSLAWGDLPRKILPLNHYRVNERYLCDRQTRDLRSFVIRFDFESYVRFEIRFVLMVRFEIFGRIVHDVNRHS